MSAVGALLIKMKNRFRLYTRCISCYVHGRQLLQPKHLRISYFFGFRISLIIGLRLLDLGLCLLGVKVLRFGVILTALAMYIFGKKIRAFYARHDILKMFHLD